MRILDYLQKKIIQLAGGVSRYNGQEDEERLTLINDKRKLVEQKLAEYGIWYAGDADELLNFYTRQTNIDYNYEPVYSRNKRGYFWSISSTESDIKRTHSGQARNIVDTLVSIIGKPEIYAGVKGHEASRSDFDLKAVLEDNDFWNTYTFEQLPMTMVEGWGCYKIDWDLDVTEHPIIKYYRAKDVEFVYRDRRLSAIIFKDYYTDGQFRQYMITETRAIHKGNLVIHKEVFKLVGDDVTPLEPEVVKTIDGLSELELDDIEITNFKQFLAVPCIFYQDTVNNDGYGRSIYCGKIDLFDDLDQCLSQSSNTVRRSTAIEYFNTDYLERDKSTGMPIMPKAYDRKYTGYVGGVTAEGVSNTNSPVQVTQPQLQFNEYNAEAQNVLLQIIAGLMSPATMGIDVAKKDNADAQREKEKITIFTRNVMIDAETRILKKLFNQILCAVQFIREGQVTCTDWSITIKYSEFADDSFENKLQKLGEAYTKGTISTDMYLDKLYGDSLSEQERKREKDFLEQAQQAGEQAGGEDENPFGGEEFDMGDEKPGFKGVDEG